MNFGLSGVLRQATGGKFPVEDSALEGAYQDTRNIYGGMRKAGQILKTNPIGALVTDLVFPDPMADGTLDAARQKGLLGPQRY